MPTTYEKPPSDVTKILDTIMGKHHKELAKEGVRVGIIMAYNDGEAAVKHGGYPAAGKIKVVSLKDRVDKPYEAELLIDQHWWNESRREHHEALIDHELTHLELVPDKDHIGNFLRDDLGRPKLKIKLGDWNGGDGFKDVVERHGDFAVEIQNLRRVEAKVAEVKRSLFPIGADKDSERNGEGEIKSLTISGAGKSVTITPESAKRMRENIDKIIAKQK